MMRLMIYVHFSECSINYYEFCISHKYNYMCITMESPTKAERGIFLLYNVVYAVYI